MKTSVLIICFLLKLAASFSQCSESSSQELWGFNNGLSVNATYAAYGKSGKDLLVCGYSLGKGFAARFNGDSTIKWAKTFSSTSALYPQFIIERQNGGFFVVGGTIELAGKGIQFFLHLDNNGNTLWSKRFLDNSAVPGLTNQYITLTGAAETPDGGIVVVGMKSYKRPDGNFNYRAVIYKLNSTGDLSWSREDTQGNDDEARAVLSDGGLIVVTGSTYSVQTGIRYGFIEKLDPATGNLVMFNRYQLDNLTSNHFRSIVKITGGYELGTQAFSFGGKIYNRLRTTTGGVQTDCIKFPDMGPNLMDQFYYPVALADGSSFLWREQYYSAQDIEISKITSSNTVAWNNQYTQPGQQSLHALLPAGNGALGVGHSPLPTAPGGRTYLYIMKLAADGKTGNCTADPLPLTAKDSLSYNVTQGTWQTTQLNFIAPFDVNYTSEDIALTKIKLCGGDACQVTSVSLTGDSIICKPNAASVYKVSIESSSCGSLPVQWTLSLPIGTIQQLNDSMISIQYTQPGTAVLKAEIQNACSVFSSQLTVQYRPATAVLELGNDISLCSGDSVTLSVSNQFPTVLWMNNSSAPILHVSNTGVYSVKASQDGICYQFDTVRVQVNALPVINLPHDSVLCTPDSIILNAGAGFTNYLWQNGSSQSTFSVKDTGRYWVMVRDVNNCKNADTVTIKKLLQKPVAFANVHDTAICYGEKIILSLSGSYQIYNWNNNMSTLPFFQTDIPGVYSVSVTDMEGCKGSDTITVRDKGCKQTLYVPTAFTPDNNGLNDLFKAIAAGPLKSYELYVYNRWGEQVFYTNRITEGWNGYYKGLLQPPASYSWHVHYLFAGNNKVETKKGFVILIR